MALSDEVKERLDIVDVVGQYVPSLQKAGRNFKALCPFHTEKTPSFVIFPERQSWRCFGACASGGDVFTFVMRVEQLGFSDALKQLAQRAGVTIPERQVRQEHQTLYRIMEAAAVFFQELLQSKRGEAARAYLEQRGVDREAMDRFQLGLSPGSGIQLLEHLSALGYPQDQAVAAGLATRQDDGPPRDMFRGRLMIPIHDDRANLVGFGGRSLDGLEPKSLNSPRTAAFDKSRILYGFHHAKEHIKKQREGVVVEGYMDVIAAHQRGFENVVASMGTAVTEAQVRLLLGVGRQFVLALDPDAAGQEATFRSLEGSWQRFQQRAAVTRRGVTLYERPFEVTLRVAILPEGRDPDQVVRDDPAEWERFIHEAQPLPEYLLAKAPAWWDLATSQGKAQANDRLYPFFDSMANKFDRERYIRLLAELLDSTPETLAASIRKPRQRPTQGRTEPETHSASAVPFERERRDPLEEHALALLLQWPELKEAARELAPEAMIRLENREVFAHWLECSTIDVLVQSVDEELQERVNALLSLALPPMDTRQREQAIRECVYRLEERRLRELKAEEALLLTHATQSALEEPEEQGELAVVEQRAMDTNERLRRLFNARAQEQRRR